MNDVIRFEPKFRFYTKYNEGASSWAAYKVQPDGQHIPVCLCTSEEEGIIIANGLNQGVAPARIGYVAQTHTRPGALFSERNGYVSSEEEG
jgi:hypothetical protein